MKNRKGKNNEMSRKVWKKVEDKANKARIAKTEIKKRKENIEKKKKRKKV